MAAESVLALPALPAPLTCCQGTRMRAMRMPMPVARFRSSTASCLRAGAWEDAGLSEDGPAAKEGESGTVSEGCSVGGGDTHTSLLAAASLTSAPQSAHEQLSCRAYIHTYVIPGTAEAPATVQLSTPLQSNPQHLNSPPALRCMAWNSPSTSSASNSTLRAASQNVPATRLSGRRSQKKDRILRRGCGPGSTGWRSPMPGAGGGPGRLARPPGGGGGGGGPALGGPLGGGGGGGTLTAAAGGHRRQRLTAGAGGFSLSTRRDY